MTLLLTLLGRICLPAQCRRIAAIAALVGAGLVALAVLKSCYDRRVIERHQERIEMRAGHARERAEAERANDAATATANHKDLDHAIDTASRGGTLSPAAHALACERLRKLGRIPPACRPGGTDGAETRARQ